jgi:hypothetical protein
MSKAFSLVVANKVGKFLEWEKNNWINNWVHFQWITNYKRRAWAEFAFGAGALFGLIWILILGHGSPAIAPGFIFPAACYLLILSVYDVVKIKKGIQRLELTEPEVSAKTITSEPMLRASLESKMSAQSVTEHTTRDLESIVLDSERRVPSGQL